MLWDPPGTDVLATMPSPRVVKTHLPAHILPKSFWENRCKVTPNPGLSLGGHRSPPNSSEASPTATPSSILNGVRTGGWSIPPVGGPGGAPYTLWLLCR